MWLSWLIASAHAATLLVGPGRPYADVDSAVRAARSGDTVLIDPGTYTITRSLEIDVDLELRGAGGVPVLRGANLSLFSVSAGDVTLAGLDLQPNGGRGVFVSGGVVHLADLSITGNTLPANQSAPALRVTGGEVIAERCVFADNSATAGVVPSLGGCVDVDGATLTLRDSTVERCSGGWGGGVHVAGGGMFTAERVVFRGNEATMTGGAVYGFGATLQIYESQFYDNAAGAGPLSDGGGGAVQARCNVCQPFTLEDSLFVGNTSDDGGGAAEVGSNDARIVRNTFCANSAQGPGGALLLRDADNDFSVLDNVFSENDSPNGAAIACGYAGESSPRGGELRNNDVLANTAGARGAAVSLGSCRVAVSNDLFMDNQPTALSGGTGVLNFNAWFGNGADLDGRTAGAADVIGVDPQLWDYTADGDCSNDDLRPLPGSPLINAGDPAVHDLDGSRSDIGATGGPDAGLDSDGDGVRAGADCDDQDPAIFPGAAEVCDGVDNDCDGGADTPTPASAPAWFADSDGDGAGGAELGRACAAPAGAVATSGDCDDARADVAPGLPEVCDDADNDCDGAIDEQLPSWYPDDDGDGYGRPTGAPVMACEGPAGTANNALDCDDGAPDRHPGQPEQCDGVDEDCDGAVDDDPVTALVFYADADADGWGAGESSLAGCAPPPGYSAEPGDCDDSDAAVYPRAPEDCDPPRDMNCDGAQGADDHDSDGTIACEDCDDYNSAAYPGAPDAWYDGAVLDCDRGSDFDADLDGVLAPQGGGADCDDDDAATFPGAPEIADDGVDQDCDGQDLVTGGPDKVEVTVTCGGCTTGGRPSPFAGLALGIALLRRRVAARRGDSYGAA